MHRIWFTSDTHFGHEKLVLPREETGRAPRPFKTVAEMDTRIIMNWIALVQPEDIVYHLGDVSFSSTKRTKEILSFLPGYKVLVRGNHDEDWPDKKWRDMGFMEVYHQRKGLYTYGPKDFGIDALMIHNPGDDLHVGKFCLHGHVHERWRLRRTLPDNRVYINVGQDGWNFSPVGSNQIKNEFEFGRIL